MKIVTGMHRSGTSFIAQALNELGQDFGDPCRLFPADRWNAKGYLENVDIIDVNNKLILGRHAAIESWLDMPESGVMRRLSAIRSRKWKYILFPSRQTISRRVAQQASRMRELADTYAHTYVKDPRFCLTLHAWQEIDVVTEVVFIFRSPRAVAESIRRREGLPLMYGLRMWRYHVDNFLRSVPPGTLVHLYNFDDFFLPDRSDAEFNRLLDAFAFAHGPTDEQAGSGRKEALNRLKAVLDIRLRNHDGDEHVVLPASVSASWETLRRLHAGSIGPVSWPSRLRADDSVASGPR